MGKKVGPIEAGNNVSLKKERRYTAVCGGSFFMPLNKEEKKKIVEVLKEKIEKQKSIVFVAVRGLKAGDFTELRKKLKKENCSLTVAKKTLLKIASQDKNIKIDVKKLEGEIALIFGFKDEISGPKIAKNFSSQNENLKILGGIFKDEFIEKEKVFILAKIPSRQELLAKLAGVLKSPVSAFVNVLEGNIKGLIYVLNSIKK